MSRTALKVLAVTAVLVLLAGAGASALKIEIGKTVVSATAEIMPRTLAAHQNTPVELNSITRINTTDGSQPEALKELLFIFDKHGSVETRGLPVCTMKKLAGTTPAVAKKRCPGAIVGEGVGKAKVSVPGAAATEISSPLTFFNAPPSGGRPSLIVHAYETVPTPQAVLVPIVVERISHGRYGFRTRVQIPEIAGGFGAATLAEATIGKTWKLGGRTVGYVSAHCQGGRLQVNGKIGLADGSVFPGTIVSPCHVPG